MAQSVYPSSPSSSPRNATSQIFATYQATGTYTYSGTLAAGKYAIVADTIDDNIGSNALFTYTVTGTNINAAFSNNGTPNYFYTSTPSTLAITGGTVTATTYPYSPATRSAYTNTGNSVVSITPQYQSGVNQLAAGSPPRGHITLKNGHVVSFTHSSGIVSMESQSITNNYVFPLSGTVFQPYNSNIQVFGTAASGQYQNYCAAGNGLLAAWSGYTSYQNQLFVSADGGITWTARTMPQTPTATTGYATIHFLNNLWIAYIANSTASYVYTSTDTITWTLRYTGTASMASYSSTYGTKYVIGLKGTAAGANNILVSTDSVTWTVGSISSIWYIYGLAWNGTRHVAVANNGSTSSASWISYSTDAVTWTLASPGSNDAGSNIVWNGTYFLTQGAATTTGYRSTDGITWTTVTLPINGQLHFATVGTSFYTTQLASQAVAYLYGSTDGATWTAMTYIPGYLNNYNGSNASSSGRLVVLGSYLHMLSPYAYTYGLSYPAATATSGLRIYVNGTSYGSVTGILTPVPVPNFSFYIDSFNGYGIVSAGNNLYYQTSSTSSTWSPFDTSISMPYSMFDYSNSSGGYYGLYVNSSNQLVQSQASTTTASSVLTGTFYAATYANNLYLAAGASGVLYTYAGNPPSGISGVTFTSRTSGFGTNAIRAIAYGNGLYVIGGDNGSLSTSTDGITWTSRTSGFGTNTIRVITGKPQPNTQWFFAAGGDNGNISTSTDGITWTSRNSGVTSSLTTAIPFTTLYSSYPILLGGSNQTVVYASASDGSSWSKIIASQPAYNNYSPDPLGTSGYAYTQNNTSTATTYIPLAVTPVGSTNALLIDNQNLYINSVAYGNNLYLAAGVNGQMYTSTDTVTWTSRSVGASDNITAVAYLNATYVAGTMDGSIYTSTDGTTWTARTSNIAVGNQINYLGYLNGKYYTGYSNHVSRTNLPGWYYNTSSGVYAAAASPLYSGWTNLRSSDFYTGGIQTSTDLITWTANSMITPPGLTGINSIAYTGSQYITANGGGVNNLVYSSPSYYSYAPYSNLSANAFFSKDLFSFASNTYLGNGNYGVVDVAYNNGWICIATNASPANAYNVWVSSDGVTWSTFQIAIPFSTYLYGNYMYINSVNVNWSPYGTPYSVTPGPGSTFIITTNSRTTNTAYLLNMNSYSVTALSIPGDAGPISPYKHNIAYNSTNGTILVANRSGKLASGTISTTTTNTYYPSIFSLYSVNA